MSCSIVQSLRGVVAGGLFAALLPLMSLAPLPAAAQSRDCVRNIAGETVCPPARTLCTTERDNPSIKCSPPDGGIVLDRYGRASCGVGSCVLNLQGEPFCSKVAGGAAGISMHAEAVCTGGCAPGQASACTTLTK